MRKNIFIELPIGEVTIEMLPYESHIENILFGNNMEMFNFYSYMFDMEGILLKNKEKLYYDFFVGRKISLKELSLEFFDRKLINTEEKLISHLLTSLLLKEYCYLSIDSSSISNYHNDTNEHKIHSPLIVGIDLKKKKIKMCDFFDFTHYTCQWVKLDEFIKGYFLIQKFIFDEKIYKDENWVLKIENIGIDSFQEEKKADLKQVFQNYLSGNKKRLGKLDIFQYVNIKLNHLEEVYTVKEEIINGIRIYDYLKNNFVMLLESDNSFVDGKSLAILYKHFLILKILIEKSGHYQSQIKDINECIKSSEKLLLFGIKIQQTKQTTLYKKMVEIIEDIEEKEKKILFSIVSEC